MSLFGLIGEVIKTPVAVLKDVCGSEVNNTKERGEKVIKEASEMFDNMFGC